MKKRPTNKPKPAKPLAERIAERLFESEAPVTHLLQRTFGKSGTIVSHRFWTRKTVTKVINEELNRGQK